MMQTVQLAIADGMYAAALREALSRSCAWLVESVDRPDPSEACVLVLDQSALQRLPLPLSNPERIVLITPKDSQLMAEAWEAGVLHGVQHVLAVGTAQPRPVQRLPVVEVRGQHVLGRGRGGEQRCALVGRRSGFCRDGRSAGRG